MLKQSRFCCGRLSVGTKPVLVQQVKGRHKAVFGAGTKPVLERLVWGRHKAGFGAGTKPVLEGLV